MFLRQWRCGDSGRWPSCHVTEKTIAITGGDAAYFDLMRDCIGSLRATPEGRALALGVLDCGLTEEQRAWCRAQGATLVVPQWDFDFPGRDKLKDGYKALTARPFLPRYFPGFDLYLWIDADCWVQQGDAIALFLRRGAHRRARGGAGDPSLDAPLPPCLEGVLDDQRRGLRSRLRQGDGRAADPLSADQCRRLRAPGRRAALGGLGRPAGRGAAALDRHDRPDRAERAGLRPGLCLRAAAQPLQLAGPSRHAGLGRRARPVRRAGHALRAARHPAPDDLHQAAGDAGRARTGRTACRQVRARSLRWPGRTAI